MNSVDAIFPSSASNSLDEHEARQLAQATMLADQVTKSPYSVVVVVSVVVYAIYKSVEPWLLVAWFVGVVVCLYSRFLYARHVLQPSYVGPAHIVMYNLTWFAFLNGLAVGISAPIFFVNLHELERAVITMVLIGLSAGGIATSAASPKVFTAYIFPALLPLAVSWGTVGGLKHAFVGVLVLLFIAILIKFVRDNNKLLEQSFAIRFQRERLVRELEQKQQELLAAMQEAKEAKEHAEEAGHAKARVLAAASHDLRQPLHALSLYSAVLSQKPNQQTLSEVSQQIDLSVRALSALLNALLDISKLDAGVYQIEPASFAVHEVLARIVQDFQPVAKSKGLMLYLDARPAQTFSDPVVFEQIARNLIDNAMKYTEQGAVLVKLSADAERINIAVHDTGKGIPEEERNRIFEEFYQLDNPSRDRELGLGLGLSIVKRLAQLIQSDVSLTSVLGEGSCFSWHIPLERRGVPPGSGAEFEDGEMLAMRKRMQILVIEDEAAIRHGMGLLLGTWGMDTHGTATQEHAENILRSVPIDLIIADLRLQDGADGLKVVNALREKRQQLPVLLISGETDPRKLRDVAASGFPLMNKPIQPEMLRKNISQLLEVE